MKKYLLTFVAFIFLFAESSAQLKSSEDNSEYAIAQKISEKAKQRNLGAIHSESAKMRPTAGKGGWFLRYEKGWVYYNPKLNRAFSIMENMMKKWGEAGYEVGRMGFPISDNLETPKVYGFYTAFENGSIYSSAKNGMHYVGGAFRDEWGKRGYENSPDLGFPKTDEVVINVNGYTRYQQFERGALFFAPGKPVLYSNNPNATTPPKEPMELAVKQYELAFIPNYCDGGEGKSETDGIDLYGWMDIRVYKADGTEINEADGKSFSLFNIPKSNYLSNEGFDSHLNFTPQNQHFQRRYKVSQTDIDANAYIRFFYWLNDYDKSSSDDYLKLQNANGRQNYNNGDHPYREVRLQDIVKSNNKTTLRDELTDGSGDNFWIGYKLYLNRK